MHHDTFREVFVAMSFINNCPHRGGIDFTPIQIFLFTVPIGTMLKPVVYIRAILYICFQAIYTVIIQYPWFSSWAAVATVVIMAATWLLAFVLIRIPITRRIFLKEPFKLPILCWAFYGLLVVAVVIYDDNGETAEARSLADFLERKAMVLSSSLAYALNCLVTLSVWVWNSKWNFWKHDPIAKMWWLINLGPVMEELFVYSPLPDDDPDLLHLSNSQLDGKPFTSEV
ncbi:hypothetical protein C8R48DRAFT_325749 [Suillus tomentosus]|nr:hypothetical protein C8R48DRAFT_325749 [Suillus tomentosus]